MTGAAESAAEQLGVGERVEVDARCTGRSGGDARVRLSRPLPAAPPGVTVLIAHPKLSSLRGKDARKASPLCIMENQTIYSAVLPPGCSQCDAFCCAEALPPPLLCLDTAQARYASCRLGTGRDFWTLQACGSLLQSMCQTLMSRADCTALTSATGSMDPASILGRAQTALPSFPGPTYSPCMSCLTAASGRSMASSMTQRTWWAFQQDMCPAWKYYDNAVGKDPASACNGSPV
jgi:hypothetical protein